MKPQLPPITVVTPCTFDGVAHRVPEQLRVVVRVRVDEAGGDDEAVGVDDLACLARRSSPTATIRPSRTPDVGPTNAGAPGAVDDRAAPDEQVEHVPVPPVVRRDLTVVRLSGAGGCRPNYRRSTMALANSLHLTSVAPSIRRAKS